MSARDGKGPSSDNHPPKEEDDLPETPLSRELEKIVRRLEAEEHLLPKVKEVPAVDWAELIRTHPAFKPWSPGG